MTLNDTIHDVIKNHKTIMIGIDTIYGIVTAMI